ncbi:MAG: polysaccharide deacetylase family protein [Solirubrobacteraceae bacterium]
MPQTTSPAAAARSGFDGDHETLLLSVDFEDWHQLVRRRVGTADWQRPGRALARQTDVLLALLDELGVRATFFILGISARAHPQLVQAIASRGHEIGSHGDAHRPVHRQTPSEFAADLRAARETIEQLTGRSPVGYRAPAFSVTRESPWAYDVLADEGLAYDASQHDSPRIRNRLVGRAGTPHRLELADGRALWEFPVAVWHAGRSGQARIPVGGASYWGVMPTQVVLRGLRHAGPFAGLYLHPHELDPEPLRAELGPGAGASQRLHGSLRAAQRNLARRRAGGVLRAIAGSHRLIPYGEAHAELCRSAAARP